MLRPLLLALFLLVSTAQAAILKVKIDGVIDPITSQFIQKAVKQAEDERAQFLLIELSTPGGLGISMQEIMQAILNSKVPIVCYVTPSGAHAASAGFFILLSADVAAMAPGTHTGAASPLLAIGGYPVTVDETMSKKILNDATAYLRSYAARRGRAIALAETAITDARAFTEAEALDGKLIDVVVDSREKLVAGLDGRTITRFDGRTSTLDLARAQVTAIEMSGRQRFLQRIVQPDVFFLLLIVGVLGLYTEFTHPGMVAPGVIGGIALVLALFAMHLLPVNLTGLVLIGLALALFILEAKYTSHGILGAGGVVAMLIGALMLVRSPLTGAGVGLGAALGVTLPFAIITVVLMRLVLRSRGWTPRTGVEELARETGEVTEDVAAAQPGLVFIHGELWRAVSSAALPKGARVRVVRVDGLTLHVEPAETRGRF